MVNAKGNVNDQTLKMLMCNDSNNPIQIYANQFLRKLSAYTLLKW